jgi:hypothetical protein
VTASGCPSAGSAGTASSTIGMGENQWGSMAIGAESVMGSDAYELDSNGDGVGCE